MCSPPPAFAALTRRPDQRHLRPGLRVRQQGKCVAHAVGITRTSADGSAPAHSPTAALMPVKQYPSASKLELRLLWYSMKLINEPCDIRLCRTRVPPCATMIRSHTDEQ